MMLHKKIQRKLILTIATSLIATTPIQALATPTSDAGDIIVSGGLGYYGASDKSAADSGMGQYLALAYAPADKWGLELLYSRFYFEGGGDLISSSSSDNFQLNVTREFGNLSAFTPYVVAGVGYVDEIDAKDLNEFADTQVSLGLGGLIGVTERLSVRAEVRANYSTEFGDVSEFLLLGLSYKIDY